MTESGHPIVKDELINHSAIDVCYEMLCGLLTVSAGDVESSASQLSNSFLGLSSISNQQSVILESLVHTAGKLEYKDGYISLEEFINIMNSHINDTIGKVIEISGNAMSLAFTMEGVVEQLDSIQIFINKVNKINQATRMLALNATIEAARAGEAGRAFSVVAQEVKQLATQIDSMAQEMKEQITKISDTLRGGQDTLGAVAGIDMSDNIVARSELENIMHSLLKQNATVSQIMQQSSDSAKELSEQISKVVVSVQFQDRNSQIISNIVALIKAMRDHEKDPLNNPLPADPAQALEKISSVVTLSLIRQKLADVALKRGIGMNIPERINSYAMSDDDNIELF